MTEQHAYPGRELELFREAHHWKKYFAGVIRPFIRGKVLENGAGIGGTTPLLHTPSAESWLLAEPDPGMSSKLEGMIRQGILPENCSVHHGTIDNIQEKFDTIIYIDVLEHISDDRKEISMAASRLNPGGHLIVLSPAFPYLYSPFDKAIGHYRRYTKSSLRKLGPGHLKMVHLRYYDSIGFFAGAMNRLLLRQKYPTKKQVRFWDNWLVPVSRLTDKLFFHAFGKAVIAIWSREERGEEEQRRFS